MWQAVISTLTKVCETAKMIEKDKIVAFHYVLRNESGEEIENILGDEPMVYLHGGYRNLLPKLEESWKAKRRAIR